MGLVNPLSANPTKWSNTLKQFLGNLPTNCLNVFDHFVGLVLKGLTEQYNVIKVNTQFMVKKLALNLWVSPETNNRNYDVDCLDLRKREVFVMITFSMVL